METFGRQKALGSKKPALRPVFQRWGKWREWRDWNP